MFRPGETATADVVRAVAAAVTWADAFLLSTPDYHGSMSGAMKNFLDYHWEEFAGKLFGYICASHEKGLTAMDQMRTAVRQCYGWSLPYGVSVHGDQDFDASGAMTNPRVAARLRMLARDLTVYGHTAPRTVPSRPLDRAADSFADPLRTLRDRAELPTRTIRGHPSGPLDRPPDAAQFVDIEGIELDRVRRRHGHRARISRGRD